MSVVIFPEHMIRALFISKLNVMIDLCVLVLADDLMDPNCLSF